MIRLVTFDVYTALVDLEGSLTPVVCHTLGLAEADARAFVRLWRRTQREGTLISNSLLKGRIPFERLTHLALDHALRSFGVEADAKGRAALVGAWNRLALWPEARAVVDAVRERGYTVAVLSNGDDAMLHALLDHVGLAFDHVFSGEQAGVYKPHPRIYYVPLEALGLTSQNVLHVAGSALDAMGAKAAGLACYWSNREGQRVLEPAYRPDHEGPNLAGLLDVIT